MEALRKEKDPFARRVLERMEANSKTAMQVALKMIRKAINMDYGQVLKMELNVALNIINDKDFELGVKEVLMKPSVSFTSPKNPGFSKKVSNDYIETLFSENPLAKKIDLEIVENCLLPTRHFYKNFSDSLRVYLNELVSYQPKVRETIDYEILKLLREYGIDYRNKTLKIPEARKQIYEVAVKAKIFEEE